MMSEEFIKADQPAIDIHKMPQSKGIRNFFCMHLYDDNMLISYAPTQEFGASTTYRWLTGGRICDYDRAGNTILPKGKVNLRIIRSLFDAGIIKVNRSIRTPHIRCVVFEWNTGVKKYRRQLLLRYVMSTGEKSQPTAEKIGVMASLYGLAVEYRREQGLFEVVRATSRQGIPIGESKRTYIFMNKSGDPVTKWGDMSISEWEETIYEVAERLNTTNSPMRLPEGQKTHLEPMMVS